MSPLIFDVIIDEFTKKVREKKRYTMWDKESQILCYADDTIMIVENEDDFQRQVEQFGGKSIQNEDFNRKIEKIVMTKEQR